jgi:signal transduction histidine kinase
MPLTPMHPKIRQRWHQRARQRISHSLRARLVLVFLLLALAMVAIFLGGMQRALSVGWREAARPLIADYVDRIAADITANMSAPPSIERALALTEKLPISVRISGPLVNWRSTVPSVEETYYREENDSYSDSKGWRRAEARLLERSTADGHKIVLGLSLQNWHDRPRSVGWVTLALLLGLTAAAYTYVRRLLRPLDDIRDGALRYGSGNFGTPIPIRRQDELGQLAINVNTMATDIHQMLEAKRGLLLAISHELRSPLTRARLNAELLPDTDAVTPQREALLRDLNEMRDLITDLLESERLGAGHSALQTEPIDLAALVREVATALSPNTGIQLELSPKLPVLDLDRTRLRLVVRNLISNALRHGAEAEQAPHIRLKATQHQVLLTVRDHGCGVDEAALPHLAEPFYRPDSARTRASGGVGLGLHLCKLVALAHGGTLTLRNASPGLEVQISLPINASATPQSGHTKAVS